jgi:cellulose synthase/poly-beta-1,6-N-acetylglucosamine synthase-like glycosyltransferase
VILEAVFWGSALFVGYAYVGYPLVLYLLSLIWKHPVKSASIFPTVSYIVTAYNEEGRIRQKIENCLQQDYPRDRLEIIVASDCSTDGTDAIVQAFETKGVRLVRAAERKGKEAVQRLAVASTTGEILVFSDVATSLTADGLSRIVCSFADDSVGCVSSVDRFIDADGKLSGEGAYVKYEMFLRRLETEVNTLVGLSGSFFAARRTVCKHWAEDLQSDFNTLLNSIRCGLRGVSDPEAVGYYRNLADERKEYERKVRTVLRGIAVLMSSLPLMNPFRYGLFAWQLFSHKLCRWLVPFGMITAFTTNLFLVPHAPIYGMLFAVQLCFYGLAIIYTWVHWLPRTGLWRLPSFFVLVNLSILDAWFRYWRGDRVLRWEPSKR